MTLPAGRTDGRTDGQTDNGFKGVRLETTLVSGGYMVLSDIWAANYYLECQSQSFGQRLITNRASHLVQFGRRLIAYQNLGHLLTLFNSRNSLQFLFDTM